MMLKWRIVERANGYFAELYEPDYFGAGSPIVREREGFDTREEAESYIDRHDIERLIDALAEIADKARYLDQRPDIEQPEACGLIHSIVKICDRFGIDGAER